MILSAQIEKAILWRRPDALAIGLMLGRENGTDVFFGPFLLGSRDPLAAAVIMGIMEAADVWTWESLPGRSLLIDLPEEPGDRVSRICREKPKRQYIIADADRRPHLRHVPSTWFDPGETVAPEVVPRCRMEETPRARGEGGVFAMVADGDAVLCLTEEMLDVWWRELALEDKGALYELPLDGPVDGPEPGVVPLEPGKELTHV